MRVTFPMAAEVTEVRPRIVRVAMLYTLVPMAYMGLFVSPIVCLAPIGWAHRGQQHGPVLWLAAAATFVLLGLLAGLTARHAVRLWRQSGQVALDDAVRLCGSVLWLFAAVIVLVYRP